MNLTLSKIFLQQFQQTTRTILLVSNLKKSASELTLILCHAGFTACQVEFTKNQDSFGILIFTNASISLATKIANSLSSLFNCEVNIINESIECKSLFLSLISTSFVAYMMSHGYCPIGDTFIKHKEDEKILEGFHFGLHQNIDQWTSIELSLYPFFATLPQTNDVTSGKIQNSLILPNLIKCPTIINPTIESIYSSNKNNISNASSGDIISILSQLSTKNTMEISLFQTIADIASISNNITERAIFLQIHNLYNIQKLNKNIAIPIYPLTRFCKVLLGTNTNGNEDISDKLNEEIQKAETSINHGIISIGTGIGPLSLIHSSMVLSHIPILCRSSTRNNSQNSVTCLLSKLLGTHGLSIIDWVKVENENSVNVQSLIYSLYKHLSISISHFGVNPCNYLVQTIPITQSLLTFPSATMFESQEDTYEPVFCLNHDKKDNILTSIIYAKSELESGQAIFMNNLHTSASIRNNEQVFSTQKSSLHKKLPITQPSRRFQPLKPVINKTKQEIIDNNNTLQKKKNCNNIACCISSIWFDPMFANFLLKDSNNELRIRMHEKQVTCCQIPLSISENNILEQWLWRDNLQSQLLKTKDTTFPSFMRIQSGGECISRLALFQRADVLMISQGTLFLNDIKELWISLINSDIPIPKMITKIYQNQIIPEKYLTLPSKLQFHIRMDDTKDFLRDQVQTLASIAGDIVRPLSSYGTAGAKNTNDENPPCHAAPIDIDPSIIYQNDSKHLLSRLASVLKDRGTVVGRTSVFRKFITGTTALEKFSMEEMYEQNMETNEVLEKADENKIITDASNIIRNNKTVQEEINCEELVNNCNGDVILLTKKCEIKHLKQWLKNRKEKVSGTKTELITRVIAIFQSKNK